VLESQRRQYWLFGEMSYYAFIGTWIIIIPLAHMSLQGIEVMNINPHSIGVDIQKLFLQGKLL